MCAVRRGFSGQDATDATDAADATDVTERGACSCERKTPPVAMWRGSTRISSASIVIVTFASVGGPESALAGGKNIGIGIGIGIGCGCGIGCGVGTGGIIAVWSMMVAVETCW